MKHITELAKKILWKNIETKHRICGQSFTNYICLLYEEEKSHCNTSVPILCPSCEKILREELHND